MNANAISAFEYIGILLSIILGLGITQLLSSAAEAFYHSAKVRFYLPHTIWVILVLFLHIQDWFVLYELKYYPIWKLPAFIFISLYPITLFSITKLLFPPIEMEETTDLKASYLNSFSKIYYLFAVCILLSITFNLLFLRAPFIQQIWLFIPFGLFIAMAITKSKKEVLHYLLSLTVLLAVLITTLAENNIWYVK